MTKFSSLRLGREGKGRREETCASGVATDHCLDDCSQEKERITRRWNELPSVDEEKKEQQRKRESAPCSAPNADMRAAARRVGGDVDLGCGNEMNETEDSSS